MAQQKKIVAKTKRRLSAAKQMIVALEQQLNRARVTRESLLRDAFAGRLVPQRSNDEPALLLLDRIRFIRDSESKKPKGMHMPNSKLKIDHRPLLDVLYAHKKPITPEQLFRESGFQREFEDNECHQDIVDKFYEELSAITGPNGPVIEKRPNRNTVLLTVRP
jgi:hypothetical protein